MLDNQGNARYDIRVAAEKQGGADDLPDRRPKQ